MYIHGPIFEYILTIFCLHEGQCLGEIILKICKLLPFLIAGLIGDILCIHVHEVGIVVQLFIIIQTSER